MHEKLTDIVFDQIDTQLNMMAHNLSENSTNVALARIIQRQMRRSLTLVFRVKTGKKWKFQIMGSTPNVVPHLPLPIEKQHQDHIPQIGQHNW